MLGLHREVHRTDRIGWLRAAVLGAQDGVGSTASLLIGVAAAELRPHRARSSRASPRWSPARCPWRRASTRRCRPQRDTEHADIARESAELQEYPDVELEELTQIYEQRGLDRPLARQVAIQLTKADALGVHVRDELGIATRWIGPTRPGRGRSPPAGSCSARCPPVVVAAIVPAGARIAVDRRDRARAARASSAASGARLGAAPVGRAALRVVAIGGVAMAIVGLIGDLLGTVV